MSDGRNTEGRLSERERRQIEPIYRLAVDRVRLALVQPRSLAGVLAAVESTRRLLAEKVREVPPRFPLACRPKCAFCCCAFVEVPPAEVVAIAYHLCTQVPSALAVELTERIVRTDERTRGLTPAARTDSLIPCPLLRANMCVLYAVRPLKCRGYGSYSRQTCRSDWDGSAPNRVSIYRWQHVVADVLVDALDSATAEAGLESMGLDLVAALRLALEDEDIIDRWLAGERVFAAAQTVR